MCGDLLAAAAAATRMLAAEGGPTYTDSAAQEVQGRCRGGEGEGEMQGRCRGDAGEMQGRCRGGAGEVPGRYTGDTREMQGKCRGGEGEVQAEGWPTSSEPALPAAFPAAWHSADASLLPSTAAPAAGLLDQLGVRYGGDTGEMQAASAAALLHAAETAAAVRPMTRPPGRFREGTGKVQGRYRPMTRPPMRCEVPPPGVIVIESKRGRRISLGPA